MMPDDDVTHSKCSWPVNVVDVKVFNLTSLEGGAAILLDTAGLMVSAPDLKRTQRTNTNEQFIKVYFMKFNELCWNRLSEQFKGIIVLQFNGIRTN